MILLNFQDDLEYIAENATDSLNIFNKQKLLENQLIIAYGKDEYISLLLTPKNNSYASLRLRTKDMTAAWDNVPIGFSKINKCRGLFNDIKRAAKVSPKRNSLWYIDTEIKNTIGDRVEWSNVNNKGFLYKLKFSNGYQAYVSLTKNDFEYKKDHDDAELFVLLNYKKEPQTDPLTASECLITLINMAMQNDIRAAEFIKTVKECGGKSQITNTYRLPDESLDKVKAVFDNNYAATFTIINNTIELEIFGLNGEDSYPLNEMEYQDYKYALDMIREVSKFPPFSLDTNDEDDDVEDNTSEK